MASIAKTDDTFPLMFRMSPMDEWRQKLKDSRDPINDTAV
jgi:hypothetical protein